MKENCKRTLPQIIPDGTFLQQFAPKIKESHYLFQCFSLHPIVSMLNIFAGKLLPLVLQLLQDIQAMFLWEPGLLEGALSQSWRWHGVRFGSWGLWTAWSCVPCAAGCLSEVRTIFLFCESHCIKVVLLPRPRLSWTSLCFFCPRPICFTLNKSHTLSVPKLQKQASTFASVGPDDLPTCCCLCFLCLMCHRFWGVAHPVVLARELSHCHAHRGKSLAENEVKT